mgnify:CR=1 FL=1
MSSARARIEAAGASDAPRRSEPSAVEAFEMGEEPRVIGWVSWTVCPGASVGIAAASESAPRMTVFEPSRSSRNWIFHPHSPSGRSSSPVRYSQLRESIAPWLPGGLPAPLTG